MISFALLPVCSPIRTLERTGYPVVEVNYIPSQTALSGDASGVRLLANFSLSKVAQRAVGAGTLCQTEPLELLLQAVQRIGPHDCHAVAQKLHASGVSYEEIIDRYIPSVARILGDYWCEDQLGFAEVTVASAQLQGLVHKLHQKCRTKTGTQTALLIVPEGTYHTLGAIVLSSQLERAGVDITLALDQSAGKLARIVQTSAYDTVLISASGAIAPASIRDLVGQLRPNLMQDVPIVLGGGITEANSKLERATGVDCVLNDAASALEVCMCNSKVAPYDLG